MKKSILIFTALTAVFSIIGLSFINVIHSNDIKLHPEGNSSQMHSKGAYGPVSGTDYDLPDLPEEVKTEPSKIIKDK